MQGAGGALRAEPADGPRGAAARCVCLFGFCARQLSTYAALAAREAHGRRGGVVCVCWRGWNPRCRWCAGAGHTLACWPLTPQPLFCAGAAATITTHLLASGGAVGVRRVGVWGRAEAER